MMLKKINFFIGVIIQNLKILRNWFYRKNIKNLSVGPGAPFDPNVSYRCFDNLLGYAQDIKKQPNGFYCFQGYDLWPVKNRSVKPMLKILTLGGSTSDTWSNNNWPKFLAKILNENGQSAIIYNGGCGGYASSQEMLKLIRDIRAIQPTHVLSYSGINDFVEWVNDDYPMVHLYQKSIAEYLVKESGAFDKWSPGLKSMHHRAENFLYHGYLMLKASEFIGARFLQILQPTLGASEKYIFSEREKKMFAKAGEKYNLDLKAFYSEVRNLCVKENIQYCIDMSDCLNSLTDIFTPDIRHVNDEGNMKIAQEISERIFNL